MPKKMLKRLLPDTHTIIEHKYLRIFGTLLHNPNLWHLNRYSVSTAFSVGLFCMFMPIPFQMVLAAAIAIIVLANLPISAALVWISNPITMPPMFYFAYKVGATVLDIKPQPLNIELSWEWLSAKLHLIWEPLLLGCFICGVGAALIGNLTIRLIWRIVVTRNWNLRRQRRKTNSMFNKP
ncbi:MAG: DUF2062 domain-containing protein [Gammaproteobacteria bacterium]